MSHQLGINTPNGLIASTFKVVDICFLVQFDKNALSFASSNFKFECSLLGAPSLTGWNNFVYTCAKNSLCFALEIKK